jgi:Spy/CpxP family protein refolding chaperone
MGTTPSTTTTGAPAACARRPGAAGALLALAILSAAAATPAAEAAQGPPGPGAGPPPGDDEAAELQETIEIYMIAKMKRDLALSRDQEERIVPLIQDLSGSRRSFNRERRILMLRLRALAEDERSSDEEIRRAVARLVEGENDFRGREARTLEQIRSHLAPRQQAGFLLFQEGFRREMRDRLRRLRDGGPAGPPRGPRRPGAPGLAGEEP